MDQTLEHNPDIGAPPPVWTRLRFEARAAAADEPTADQVAGRVEEGDERRQGRRRGQRARAGPRRKHDS